MKAELTLVLKSTVNVYQTLEAIKNDGFNATVASTESLRHATDYYEGDHHFLGLRHLEAAQRMENVLCLFVVDQERLEKLKDSIRRHTGNFNDVHGFMYSHPIEDFEGSIHG